jgi:hypothetical protein
MKINYRDDIAAKVKNSFNVRRCVGYGPDCLNSPDFVDIHDIYAVLLVAKLKRHKLLLPLFFHASPHTGPRITN